MFRLLYWLLPYQESPLHLRVSINTVFQKFEALSIKGINYGESSSLISYQYNFHLKGNLVKIIGPFGNRRWTLVTKVKIQPEVDMNGTVLYLTMRLANRMFIQVCSGALIYGCGAVWVFRDTEDLVTVFFLAILQMSIIGYIVTLISFRIEAARLVNLLVQKLEL